MLKQSKPPIEFPGIEIECKQAVESGGCQEDAPIFAYDLVAVLQITISKGPADLKIFVIAKQLVTGGDVYVVAVEGDAAQATISASTVEINRANILLTSSKKRP